MGKKCFEKYNVCWNNILSILIFWVSKFSALDTLVSHWIKQINSDLLVEASYITQCNCSTTNLYCYKTHYIIFFVHNCSFFYIPKTSEGLLVIYYKPSAHLCLSVIYHFIAKTQGNLAYINRSSAAYKPAKMDGSSSTLHLLAICKPTGIFKKKTAILIVI